MKNPPVSLPLTKSMLLSYSAGNNCLHVCSQGAGRDLCGGHHRSTSSPAGQQLASSLALSPKRRPLVTLHLAYSVGQDIGTNSTFRQSWSPQACQVHRTLHFQPSEHEFCHNMSTRVAVHNISFCRLQLLVRLTGPTRYKQSPSKCL